MPRRAGFYCYTDTKQAIKHNGTIMTREIITTSLEREKQGVGASGSEVETRGVRRLDFSFKRL